MNPVGTPPDPPAHLSLLLSLRSPVPAMASAVRPSSSTTYTLHRQIAMAFGSKRKLVNQNEVILLDARKGKNSGGSRPWRCKHCDKKFTSSYTRIREHFLVLVLISLSQIVASCNICIELTMVFLAKDDEAPLRATLGLVGAAPPPKKLSKETTNNKACSEKLPDFVDTGRK
ncbi:hypothetical protein QYE76_046406 [Lolium multiflorum]|uniref:Uncharacterized protein n=1 Tax=Lolium multiflorum TaxID=4521 RepID=A0AAD8TPG5_LOLMU|nr:hypothetical protein QYE76_046406 [Lolium multiflorum]